jgi:hypothetical protein
MNKELKRLPMFERFFPPFIKAPLPSRQTTIV